MNWPLSLQRAVVWLGTGDNAMWVALAPCAVLLAVCVIGMAGGA